MSKKLILSISILAIGVVGSLYVIGSAERDVDVRNFISDDFLTAIQQDLLARDINELRDLPVAEGNLTDLLSHTYAKHLAENYSSEIEALNSGGGYVSLPIITIDEIIDDEFETRANEMLSGIFSDKYKVENITILNNSDNEAKNKYLEDISSSFNDTVGSVNLTSENIIINWMRTEDPTEIIRYSRAINNFIEELVEIETPPSFAGFHLSNINLWNKQKNILNALTNFEEDPLKTLVALGSITSIEENIERINNEIKKVNINE